MNTSHLIYALMLEGESEVAHTNAFLFLKKIFIFNYVHMDAHAHECM